MTPQGKVKDDLIFVFDLRCNTKACVKSFVGRVSDKVNGQAQAYNPILPWTV
jgi:hypothetical protein